MSEFSRETLLNIIETDHVQCGEASALARMALAAMDSSESVELPLDYLQGHKDGLEWASQLAEANHPETGDWLYDDPIELAKAIRKGPDMPPSQPALDTKPVAYTDERNLGYIDRGRETAYLWGKQNSEASDVALYRHAQPAPVVPVSVPDEYVAPVPTPTNLGYEAGWNACRAAMLAAAQHDTPALNSLQSVDSVAGKWIPVSERMPEDRISVILWDAEIGEVTSGHYSHKTQTFYHCGDAIENEITHWMPPPAAPQEVK
ncbi:TPA: DUF551 domain-containing protein [Klebsiella pneumoniae subsp. pneumoniae]|nr:DUF551 domain-containing protein [Klebsiella pneumoniae subsp. pneumoniae]